jgi:hypothetical protein
VPLAPGLEDEVARPGLDDVVAELSAHPPLEHEAVLVLMGVTVKRCREPARADRVLDQGETAAGLLGPGHEADA